MSGYVLDNLYFKKNKKTNKKKIPIDISKQQAKQLRLIQKQFNKLSLPEI